MYIRNVRIVGDPESHSIDVLWEKNELLNFLLPQLDLIVESRVRIINFVMFTNTQTNWILEYLYETGLRQGDIVCTMFSGPPFLMSVSDLDSNEPLF